MLRNAGATLAAGFFLAAGNLTAQAAGSVPAAASSSGGDAPTEIRWYHGVATLGIIALATTLDEPAQEYTQSHRTETKDDVADVFRTFGEKEVFLPVALGPLAIGVLSGNDDLIRAGGRIAMSLATAGVVTNVLKLAVGRTRPSQTDNAYEFAPFSGGASWPSGHTSAAFAMAASVGDEIGSTPVSIALYTAAGLTGWSRINDNRHWFSDVLAGAVIGVASAKLMNGKWRVFGIDQPPFLANPTSVSVRLSF